MIKKLERSQGKVLGFEASETIKLEEIKAIEPSLEDAIVKYGKTNWLMVMETDKCTSLRAMYEDMSWGLKYLKHFNKIAVVGDKKWEDLLIKADRLVFGEKYFDASQMDEAWEYVEG